MGGDVGVQRAEDDVCSICHASSHRKPRAATPLREASA